MFAQWHAGNRIAGHTQSFPVLLQHRHLEAYNDWKTHFAASWFWKPSIKCLRPPSETSSHLWRSPAIFFLKKSVVQSIIGSPSGANVTSLPISPLKSSATSFRLTIGRNCQIDAYNWLPWMVYTGLCDILDLNHEDISIELEYGVRRCHLGKEAFLTSAR